MHSDRVPDSVFAAATSTCVVEPEQLNSELIADRFGNYGIELIDVEDGVRRSSLYSVGDGTKTCRTFAAVRIDELPDGLVDGEHDLIMRGASIGATFRNHGWNVFKETVHVDRIGAPPLSPKIARLMGLDGKIRLAMHIYRLLPCRGTDAFCYATVVEVHHPDYMGLRDIEESYIIDTPASLSDAEIDNLTRPIIGST